jgi:hypothetical protein
LTPESSAPTTADLTGRALAYRAALAGFTLAMLGLSAPLWVGGGTFPKVPFVPALPALAGGAAWARFAALIAAVAAGVLYPRAWMAAIGAGAWMVAEDQHRFQPWAYQFGLCALAMATLPAPRALACCRVVMVALYVHSGLSKLDATFARELGPLFLSVLLRPAGLDPYAWPGPIRAGLALCLPLAELLVGLGLVPRATRRLALAGAIGLHLTLLFLLGPLGLGHSTIVLAWNLALIAQNALLFGAEPPRWPALWAAPGRARAAPILALLAGAVALPLGERRGLWDSWPSFAVYASHAERTAIDVHVTELAGYPPEVLAHVAAEGDRPASLWRRVDLTSWSRAERGTPVYPQSRAAHGVAEALADWGGKPRLVRVQHWTRAGRFTGQRRRAVAVGRAAIRRLGDTFKLNAHLYGE